MKRNATIIALLSLHVWFSSDVKAQWAWDVTLSAEGGGQPHMFSLSCSGAYCTVCGEDSADYRMIFWHSTDAGKSWTVQNPGLAPAIGLNSSINMVYQIDSSRAYAAGYHDDSLGVIDSAMALTTTDAGATWLYRHLPITSNLSFPERAVHFSDPQTGIGIGGRYIYLTTDCGSQWDTLPFKVWGGGLDCHSYGGGKFRVFNGGEIYTTYDSWQSVDSATYLPRTLYSAVCSFKHCAFGTGDTLIAYGFLNNRSSVICRSVDGGYSWDSTVFGAEVGSIWSMSSLVNNTIVAGATYGIADDNSGKSILLISTDAGATWAVDSSTFVFGSGNTPRSIAIASANEYVGLFGDPYFGDSFLARYALESSSVREIAQDSEMILSPNPAINFIQVQNLSQDVRAGRTILRIMDAIGRTQNAHIKSNIIDVSQLPAGVYYLSDGNSRARFVKE